MTKLLNRPLRAFALYSFIVLVISIPVYFYVVDLIWRSELDEHNQLIRDRIAGRLDDQSIEAGELARLLDWWNTLQPGTTLRPAGQWPARRD
ncbi:MAG: hypothetical protein KDC54_16960, partial [Lewinella sp.]|nr:hypothetical protein [Lewinella sp.]